MKVAVSVSGSDLDSSIDPRFGRSQGFLIVDTDSMDFKAISNPSMDAAGGAGIQTGQMIAGEGVEAVITGNVGPKAYSVLEAAGVKVYTGASGTAREAVEAFKEGNLNQSASANVDQYYGIGGSGGGGGGRGGGGGMGRGGGGGGRGGGGGGRGGGRW
jgi:predicted Fe-Mo cluster-binding NifX family protein